jgi:ATP-dependent DNA helicase PIF1
MKHGGGNLAQSQPAVTEAVLNAVANGPRLFFQQGPGGTGKTFVDGHLLAKLRSLGKIALAVASSGFAAILPSNGRTAHIRFKLPVKNLTANSAIKVSKPSTLAELLRKTELVIWGEAPMQHRHCAVAVSRCFRDVPDDPLPFGGSYSYFCRRLGSNASHNPPR